MGLEAEWPELNSLTLQAETAPPSDNGAEADSGMEVTFWIVIFLGLTVMFIAKINPLKILARLLRPPIWLGRRLLRALGILRKMPRQSAVANGTWTLMGPLSRMFSTKTKVEQLLDPVEEKPEIEVNDVALFSWIRPLTVPMLTGKEDLEQSHLVFHYDIPISEILVGDAHEYFYEDIDASFIIRLFRGHDRTHEGIAKGPDDDFYIVANAMRKKINDNVRRFATWLTLSLTAFFLLNVFQADIKLFFLDLAGERPDPASVQNIFELWPLLFEGNTYLLLTSVVTVILMGLFNFNYRYAQRNNIRELDTYCRSYLAYVSKLFDTSKASVLEAIGSSTDEAKDKARTGVTRMQWLAWRAFFIETFLRGIFYQIKRNSFHYTLLIPIIFSLATWFAYEQLHETQKSFIQYLLESDQTPVAFFIVFAALAFVYFFVLFRSPAILSRSIDENAWIEFHKLRVEGATNEVVGRLVTEISNWRERFSGRGGSGMH
ncbi:MAG: hypothetical protein ACLFWF_00230 [Alphaproteobacteria bacterium]